MIRFQTLGAIDLSVDGKALATLLAQPKRMAILAYLACARPAGFRSRDSIMALFWPESDAERGRNSLRQALHHLRRGLGEAAIPSRGDHEVGVALDVVWCDAARFDAAIAEGRFEEALDLYGGEFLPGLFVQDAPDAERWIDEERAHRRRMAVDAARRLMAAAEAAGDLEGARRWGHRAVAIDPDDQAVAARLAALLASPVRVPAADVVRAAVVAPPAADRAVPAVPAPPPAVLPPVPSAPPPASPPPAAPSGAATDPAGAGGATATVARRGGRWWVLGGVVAAALVLAGVGLWRSRRPAPPAVSSPPSIAVLPFVNMSGDPANEVLADGLTEELLNRLAQLPGLRVAARTSAFAFKGRNVPIDSIGRVLRVGYVLEGSIRQSAAGWRITAQLIDAASGYHLFSGNFDTSLDDVVAVQDSIGIAIVSRLLARVDSARTLRPQPPRDAAAHLATIKGWRAFRLNSPDGYAAAIGHFRTAIARDPRYGYALAGLATVRMWQGYLRWAATDSAYAEAYTLASQALALDSSLVDGWLVLGRLAEVANNDAALAEQRFRRAMVVAPGDPRPYSRLAGLLARRGEGREAIVLAERAVELDPASPAVYSDLANVYAELERPADAERTVRQALALDPGHPILLGNLALQLLKQEKFAAAESVIVRVRAGAPANPVALGQHAYIAARLGKGAMARALLDTAESRSVSRVEQAIAWLALGDTARTLAALERGVRDGDDELRLLRDTTYFRGLRGDARFQRLVRQVEASRTP